MSTPDPFQVQCERFYIKPYNPFIYVSVPVPERASVIKPSVPHKSKKCYICHSCIICKLEINEKLVTYFAGFVVGIPQNIKKCYHEDGNVMNSGW